ncbi:hypothetical protein DERP_002487 [Dermatophagoides pteronyssinus]|uniref:Uncharacterized protein n=1 Tax=Dermatophagoides pteronyssinus TaxID=6956 RepID=A0ABQ8JI86_DERPT|nr:hypothetical protein DERP_002487 [Dermatophagoides pteronyssinus]
MNQKFHRPFICFGLEICDILGNADIPAGNIRGDLLNDLLLNDGDLYGGDLYFGDIFDIFDDDLRDFLGVVGDLYFPISELNICFFGDPGGVRDEPSSGIGLNFFGQFSKYSSINISVYDKRIESSKYFKYGINTIDGGLRHGNHKCIILL